MTGGEAEAMCCFPPGGKRGKLGQTFLRAKLLRVIICVFVLLVGRTEGDGAVIDDTI